MFGRCIHNIDTLSCLPRIQFINPCVRHLTNKVKVNHCLTEVWLETVLFKAILYSSYVNTYMYMYLPPVPCVCVFVFQDDEKWMNCFIIKCCGQTLLYFVL